MKLAGFFVLFLLAFSLVSAGAIDEFARVYLKSGESATFSNVTLSGVTYNILKINSEPSIVLVKDDLSFKTVLDEETLTKVFSDYLEKEFKESYSKTFFASMNDSYVQAMPFLTSCSEGANQFSTSLPRRYVAAGTSQLPILFLIKRLENTTLKAENAAIKSMNATTPLFNASINSFSSAFTELMAKQDSLIVEKAATASKFLEATASIKVLYNNMSSSYATIVNSKGDSAIFSGTTLKYFFWINGAKKDCAYNSTVAAALAKIETEITARKVKPAAQLSAQVNSSTVPREKDARQKLLVSTKNASLESTQLTVSGINSKYFEAGKLNLSISVKLAELNTVFEQIKKANNTETAEEKAKVFDEINVEIEALIQELEKVFPDYKKARSDVANASSSVEAIKKRYGEIDDRVVALEKNVTQLKQELLASEEMLSKGSIAQANFAKISKNSEIISSQAVNLKPKEALLDPITILGVVVVILLLLGTVWYFKKLKQSREPPKEFKV